MNERPILMNADMVRAVLDGRKTQTRRIVKMPHYMQIEEREDAESNLESTKESVLAQMSTVDEVVRTLDHISAQLRDKRLMLDKLVKSEKESRKMAIVIKVVQP